MKFCTKLKFSIIQFILIKFCRYFRHEEESKYSVIVQQVGNVTADTELTFEYGVRTKPSKIKPKAVKEGPYN